MDNQKITNTIVAQITSTLTRVSDKSHVLIEVGTPEGKQSGLLHDSLVSCNNLATIDQGLIQKVIGTLSTALVQKVNLGLKAALDLP